PLAHWTSPATEVRYPSRWRVQVASAGLELQIEPWLAAQELPLSFRYWEGAVKVTGSAPGQGYVELTGY
ncbi:MAG: carotenoid 1,2-hydratase, partial [Candidatus Melainabacteria bacterium HGW-Melainabacteria-1]